MTPILGLGNEKGHFFYNNGIPSGLGMENERVCLNWDLGDLWDYGEICFWGLVVVRGSV
jgi:hypothetical protein